jgi:ligand-binding sensor domain-containing protein
MFYQTQDKSSPLSDNLILSLSSDDSLLIIGTQNGMKLLNLDSVKKNKIEYVKIFHEDANELLTSRRTILSQFRASSNLIYSGTPAGLVKIDLGTRKSEFIPYRGHTFFPFWHNRILSIVQDKNGNLWFACSGGLVIYNPISGNFRYYFHDPKDDQSLSLNNITSLFTDRGGKIWIGTAGKGINFFDQNKKEFSLYNGLVDREPFKTSFSVSAILAENDNFLWIASQQKLFRLDRVTGEYKYINLLYGPEGEITSLVKDNKQNIWVSSSGGLHKISENGNRITYYGHNPSNPNSLKDLFVRLLFIDSGGNLYALNSRYMSRFNEKIKFIHSL